MRLPLRTLLWALTAGRGSVGPPAVTKHDQAARARPAVVPRHTFTRGAALGREPSCVCMCVCVWVFVFVWVCVCACAWVCVCASLLLITRSLTEDRARASVGATARAKARVGDRVRVEAGVMANVRVTVMVSKVIRPASLSPASSASG